MPQVNVRTLKPSGGDYSSFSAWEADRDGDLVSDDRQEVLEIYAQLFDVADMAGWTTDATRNCVIRVPAGERHAFKPGSGAGLRGWGGGLFGWTISNLRVEDVRFDYANGVVSFAPPSGQDADIVVSRCMCQNGSSGFRDDGAATAGKVVFVNCLAINVAERAFRITHSTNHGTYAYNCTAVDCASTSGGFFAFDASGTAALTCKNCVAQNPNVALGGGGSGHYASSTTKTACLSGDSTGNSGLQNKTVSFVGGTPFDSHLSSGDTEAKDKGVNLSSDPVWAFSDDGDGETRTGTWDLGFDELPSTPASLPPVRRDRAIMFLIGR